MIPGLESRRPTGRERYRLLAVLLSILGAIAVYLVAVHLFPHHSTNHDEAVYLQQAAMLLEGRLALRPPVVEAFRPWFFVREGGRLYPKYSPVSAAVFALGHLAGGYRTALAGIAACNVALAYAVTAEAFDPRTGVLAAALVVASPLFLIDSALFLPYAPTTALNLLFAFAYLRADRLAGGADADGHRAVDESPRDRATDAARSPAGRWAALAGAAVGLAFFSRPYTAVLFAAPFLGHACWTLVRDGRETQGRKAEDGNGREVEDGNGREAEDGNGREAEERNGRETAGGWARWIDPGAAARQSVTAALGLGGVALTLGYNALVTGDPLLFPYQAFAPLDGLGFGRRKILGYERTYTPALALRANAEVVYRLFARWVAGGPAGTALAAVGLGAWLREAGDGGDGRGEDSTAAGASEWTPRPDPRRAVLAGLFVTVPAGNVYFWGNLNVLGDLSVPGDGLVHLYGPYYHFDLLVPTAAFGAHGALWLAGRWRELLRATDAFDARRARAVGTAGLLVGAAVFAGSGLAALDRPVDENRRASEQLGEAYAPFENRTFERALVFLPTPYGDWLNHPFQKLRNDPGYDGRAVYALRTRQFAVVDAFPDRRLYRYSFRGEWLPTRGRPVEPRLRRIRHVRGSAVVLNATLGIPDGVERAAVRVGTAGGSRRFAVRGTPRRMGLTLRMTADGVRVSGPLAPARPGEAANRSVALGPSDRVVLTVTLFYPTGAGVTYRLVTPVRRADGDLRALSPYVEACRIAGRCGGEAAYVPGEMGDGVTVETSLVARNRSESSVTPGRGRTPEVTAPVPGGHRRTAEPPPRRHRFDAPRGRGSMVDTVAPASESARGGGPPASLADAASGPAGPNARRDPPRGGNGW